MNNPKIITLKDRIHRAIKAFKGENIGSLQFGIDVKKRSECREDRKEREVEVLFLCDRRDDCECCSYPTCKHTTNFDHAKNFRKAYVDMGNMVPEKVYYIENEDGE